MRINKITRLQYVGQLIVVMVVCLVLPFLLAWEAVGCPTGCVQIDKQTCACEDTEEKDTTPPVKPSNDVAPSHGGKREDVVASTGTLSHEDQDKSDADHAGKKAAGIN